MCPFLPRNHAFPYHSGGRKTTMRVEATVPKAKSHLRGLMYRLFEKAMLWELIPFERNPIGLVELKGVSKRRNPPRILTEEEFVALLKQLLQPYKIDGSTGRLHRNAHQRGSRVALAIRRLRAPGHGRHRRLCPKSNHKTEIRVLAGGTASRPG